MISSCYKSQVQYGAYAGVGGIGSIIKLMFAGMIFWLLVKFTCGRNLLMKVNKEDALSTVSAV